MTRITKYKTENGKTCKVNSAKGKNAAPDKNGDDNKNLKPELPAEQGAKK